ncbi:sensor histidine kinase [Ruegeria halocynthiae]|uniref:sensor histidine kinase n=1 Tax=Ruegeria halocynthiae TaxID=985054 RepID=UPI00068ED3DB|nr:HAMP domain-containing sensor histidine kinase [Ruegeria halocynthiae]
MPDSLTGKWRPRLWAVVLLVLGLVLCLPFAGLFLFKFYANQLVQQTEESLLTQASVMAAVYAELYRAETSRDATNADKQQDYTPVFPSLSMQSEAILPPRPDAVPITKNPDVIYLEIGPELSRIAAASQVNTLAGYRLLDPNGNVIGGSAEVGLSLLHVDEVARALQGEIASVARERIRETPEPVLYAFSRGTRVRVFTAMPVVIDSDIIGAVYISRTPNHIFRFFYGERFNLAKAGLFIIVSTGLIGFIFWRFITRPIQTLIHRTRTTGNGKRWEPLNHYGTREIENLSRSFQSLTGRLQSQQDALKSYTAHVTHELRSPLTGVKGAVELLRDAEMTSVQRSRFLDNIDRDTARMEDLLASMRAFSLAEQNAIEGTCSLTQIEDDIRMKFHSLVINILNNEVPLPAHQDTLKIVLTHLLENAQQHGADDVTLEVSSDSSGTHLTITDNGKGISDGNRDRVLTPFFTTRRDLGGTGMGLNIVKAIVEALDGCIKLEPYPTGARFRIGFNGNTID